MRNAGQLDEARFLPIRRGNAGSRRFRSRYYKRSRARIVVSTRDVAPLAWIALIPLCVLLYRGADAIETYCGLCMGWFLFPLIVLNWMRSSHSWFDLHAIRVVQWLALSELAALVMLLVFMVFRIARLQFVFPAAVGFPIFWLTYEFFNRSAGLLFVQTPLPWMQIATTQVTNVRLLQCADLSGAPALAFLIASVNGLLADIVMSLRKGNRPAGRRIACGAIVVCAVLIVAQGYGSWRLSQPTSFMKGPCVALMPFPTGRRLLQGGGRLQAPQGADLLLWPEESVWGDLIEPTALVTGDHNQVRAALVAEAKRLGRPLMVGLPHVCRNGPRTDRYNAAVFVDADRSSLQSYHKRFLVPGVEFRTWIGFHTPRRNGGYVHGTSPVVCDLYIHQGRDVVRVAPTICYDSCFTESHRDSMRFAQETPDMFVALSCELADDTLSLQKTILAQSQLRAVECRRPIVRNVHGGFSGVIDSRGVVTELAPGLQLSDPYVTRPVPLDRRHSPYLVLGDWCTVGSLTLFLTGSPLAWAWRRLSHRAWGGT